MKKKLLVMVLSLLSVGAFAQDNLIYTTIFPSGDAPFGWSTQIMGFEAETDWYFGDTYLPGAGNFSAPAAIFNDDISFDETSHVRLISPAFDVSGYTTVTLSFDYGLSKTDNNLGRLAVQVFDGAQWQQIMMVADHTLPTPSGDIDVTQYKNEAFQVRFIYNDEYGSSWGAGVANFLLEGTYDVVPNDLVVNAFPLTCGQTVFGTTVTATAETGLPVCNSVNGNTIGVWYKFSDLLNQSDVILSLCDSETTLDTRLSVFKGLPEALECITANDNNCGNLSSLTFVYDGYSDYYILVSGEGATTGNFTLNASCTPIVPPNDEIANAYDVDSFEQPYTDHAVQFMQATSESQAFDYEVNGCDGGTMPFVWYKFTAAGNGTVQVALTTPSPGGLNLIHFYSAPNEEAAVPDIDWVNQPTNPCNSFSDSRSIQIAEGTTYYIAITLEGGNSDVAFEFTFEPQPCDTPDAPEGQQEQSFTAGETVSNLEVAIIEGAIVTWYLLDEDVYVVIPADTVLEDGTTYYVSQSVGDCMSDYFGITASLTAGTDEFAAAAFRVYPNPTSNYIYIKHSNAITNVAIVNLLGQVVIRKEVNANEVELDLGTLQKGTYILQVEASDALKSLKVVKM